MTLDYLQEDHLQDPQHPAAGRQEDPGPGPEVQVQVGGVVILNVTIAMIDTTTYN